MSGPVFPRDALPAHAAEFSGWVNPMPRWVDQHGRVRLPVTSSGYMEPGSSREHHGVDMGYRRQPEEPFDQIHGTKAFFNPDGIFAMAAGAGKVWSAGVTHTADGGIRGEGVLIDHGKYSTFYNHGRLGTLQVRKGDYVVAGQRLFEVHHAPHQGPHAWKHLHFEMRLGKTQFNPDPYLKQFRLVDQAGP